MKRKPDPILIFFLMNLLAAYASTLGWAASCPWENAWFYVCSPVAFTFLLFLKAEGIVALVGPAMFLAGFIFIVGIISIALHRSKIAWFLGPPTFFAIGWWQGHLFVEIVNRLGYWRIGSW